MQIRGLNPRGGDEITLASLFRVTLKYFLESWDRKANAFKVSEASFILRNVPDLGIGFRTTRWGYVMYSLLAKTMQDKELYSLL